MSDTIIEMIREYKSDPERFTSSYTIQDIMTVVEAQNAQVEHLSDKMDFYKTAYEELKKMTASSDNTIFDDLFA